MDEEDLTPYLERLKSEHVLRECLAKALSMFNDDVSFPVARVELTIFIDQIISDMPEHIKTVVLLTTFMAALEIISSVTDEPITMKQMMSEIGMPTDTIPKQ